MNAGDQMIDGFCRRSDMDADVFSHYILGPMMPCFVEFLAPAMLYGTFIFMCIYRIHQLIAYKSKYRLSTRWVQYIKIFCCAILVLIPALGINAKIGRGEASSFPWGVSWTPFEITGYALAIVGWSFALAVCVIELVNSNKNGTWITRFLFLFAVAVLTTKLVPALSLTDKYPSTAPKDIFYWEFIVQYAAVVVLGVISLIHYPGRSWYEVVPHYVALRQFDEEEDLEEPPNNKIGDDIVNPEERAGLFSLLTFSWMNPLLAAGYKAPLIEEDVWKIGKRDTSMANYAAFEVHWDKELKKKGDRREQPSLILALWNTFGTPILMSGFFKLITDGSQFLGPAIMQQIIAFINDKTMPDYYGYALLVGMFIGNYIGTISEAQYFQIISRAGMHIRCALVHTIFRKATQISNQALKEVSTGKIVNLVSSDADSLEGLMTDVHTLWSAPLSIMTSMFYLYMLLGPAAFVGLVMMLGMLVAQKFIVERSGALMRASMLSTDERVKVSTEVMSHMNVVKSYAWEDSFLDRIMNVRRSELEWIKKNSLLNGFNAFVIGAVPVLVTVATFAVYISMGNNLTAATAFTSISLFNVLRMPLIMLPQVITQWTTAQVAADRMLDFLTSTDVDAHETVPIEQGKPVISITNTDFSWDRRDEKAALKNISLQADEGDLVAVIGGTGMGKSSLLNAVLGEMSAAPSSKLPYYRGTVAYVPQQAWILQDTVRENILFGKPYDEEQYNTAVRVSALERDFELMPAGDMTEIGEKGSNLSGGQKQRLSIARAVYANADVYLFDDPLSALDAHVAKTIFDDCICGYLKGKTIIFATNRLEFLGGCNKVVVMKDGAIDGQGTQAELAKSCETYNELLANMGTVEQEPEEKPKEEMKDKTLTKKQSRRKKKDVDESQAKLVSDEERTTGGVQWETVEGYIMASGGWAVFSVIMATFGLSQLFQVAGTFWLQRWSGDSEKGETTHSMWYYLTIYFFISMAQVLINLLNQLIVVWAGLWGGAKLHNDMIFSLFRAPMSFFNATPVGRIINRITRDVTGVDRGVMRSLSVFVRGIIQIIGSLAVIGIVTPHTLAVFAPVMCLFYWIYKYYQASNRELKRLDSIARSPIYAHLNQCLDGLTSIRSYRAHERMWEQNAEKLDAQVRFDLFLMSCNSWLTVRLELLGGIMLVSAGSFAVAGRHVLEGGAAGNLLSYALQITGLLTMIIHLAATAETGFNSVERLVAYAKIAQEAPSVIPDNRPPASWPPSGEIKFEDVSMKYRDDLPPVLKNVTFTAKPGEKIGICGRTGAGKSTTFLTLFRIYEACNGKVTIDGIDVSKIGLRDLRSKLSIIPQEPVLFTGTLRTNLDPFDEHNDFKIWHALERSHLKELVSEQADGLDMKVDEDGKNFSVGQRQLICLARALLRGSKILVLDEATAAVDLGTDALIQRTINQEFADCTILTIAHRLNTIIDYDKIMVLDAGQLREFDTPANLLRQEGSIFASMVDDTGADSAKHLREVAFGQLNRQEELQQEVEKYKPLTRLTRRLSKIGEITWMGQDVKTSLETIKKFVETPATPQKEDEELLQLFSLKMLVGQLDSMITKKYKSLAARAAWDPMAELIGDQYMEDGIKKESTPDRLSTQAMRVIM